jgi:hypothetical protein
MQGDPEPALHRLATRLLRNLHTAHPSFVVDRLHDGFHQAFAFQTAAAAAKRRLSQVRGRTSAASQCLKNVTQSFAVSESGGVAQRGLRGGPCSWTKRVLEPSKPF